MVIEVTNTLTSSKTNLDHCRSELSHISANISVACTGLQAKIKSEKVW